MTTIENFDFKITAFGIKSKAGNLIKPRSNIVQNLFFGSSGEIDFNNEWFIKIVSAVEDDLNSLNLKISKNIRSQLNREARSNKNVYNRYGVLSDAIDRQAVLSDISEAHMNCCELIKSPELLNSMSGIVSVSDKFELAFSKLLKIYNCTLEEIWKKIQASEKYHNDNERYKYARYALIFGALSLLVSLFTVSFQQYNYWFSDFKSQEKLVIFDFSRNSVE